MYFFNLVNGKIIAGLAVKEEESSALGRQQLIGFEANILFGSCSKEDESIRKGFPCWNKEDFKPIGCLR